MPEYFADVSHWQSEPPKQPINWTRTKAAGLVKVYIKASESTNFTDPAFGVNWAGAKAVGIKRGAYHFFRGQANGRSQAQKFKNVVGADVGEMIPQADVEAGAAGVTRATYTARLREFLLETEDLFGRQPGIYTRESAWNQLTTQPSWIADFPLWLAAPDSPTPPLPAGAVTWSIHQYSWTGEIDGISGECDLNRENVTPPTPPPDDTDVAAIRANALAIIGLV